MTAIASTQEQKASSMSLSDEGPSEPSADSQCLAVNQITLTDFRNYTYAKLDLDPGLVVLVGENGAGKTNLLEAVSLLAPGRGLRSAPFGELANARGKGGWAVAAKISGPQGISQIGTGMDPPQQSDGKPAARQVRIDESPVRGSGALGELVRILWLTPAMDRLFSGPASDRRRFLDRMVLAIDPEHGQRANSFEKAMRERNRLLSENVSDPSWLDAVELQMAQAGTALAAARAEAIGILSDLIVSSSANHGDVFPRADISLEGELEQRLKLISATEVEDEYCKILYDSRNRDQAAGRTLNGPHRSDLIVYHNVKDTLAKQCSTGEQKALLISIILAQASIVQKMFEGFAPLLLLDEIAAHLDAARRAALFGILSEMGVQAWMTGTDQGLFEISDLKAQIYNVDNGDIIEV